MHQKRCVDQSIPLELAKLRQQHDFHHVNITQVLAEVMTGNYRRRTDVCLRTDYRRWKLSFASATAAVSQKTATKPTNIKTSCAIATREA